LQNLVLTLAFSYDIAIISIATRCDVTAAMTVGSRALGLELRELVSCGRHSWFSPFLR